MNVDHLLKQSCTVSTAGVVDKFNKLTYAAPTTYKCRFQKTTRVIATPQNEKTPIDGLVWLVRSAVVAINDKLIFGGVNYKVMRIEPIVDRNGTTRHLELMVQIWNT